MNAQQLKNSILQDLYSAKDGWNIKELKDVVADSCPISYGIVQQGNHVDGGVPVVRPVDLHTKYVGIANLKCTSKDISDSYKRTVLNGNEVLLCVRGTTGIVALATEELKGCNVNRGIVPLYFGDDVDKLFIYYQLQTPFVQNVIEENTMGSALKQINIKDLRTLKLLVPPLAEQQRIVAKIEELLPKVEKYGKAQDALNKLNAELPERLKKSILQEAITGRLVPQDPNDEPASVLLQRIRAEKERLVKEGELKKKDLEEIPISEDEKPFEIPESWEWCKLGNILKLKSGDCIKISSLSEDSKYPVYGGNGINGSYDYYNVEAETLIVGRVGFYCGSVHKTNSRAWVTDNALIVTYNKSLFHIDYMKYALIYLNLSSTSNSTAQPVVSGKGIYPLLIPLPPLAEQKRIVAKIEEVFKEIDMLKK